MSEVDVIHEVPKEWLFLLRGLMVEVEQTTYHANQVKLMLQRKIRECAAVMGIDNSSDVRFEPQDGKLFEIKKNLIIVDGEE